MKVVIKQQISSIIALIDGHMKSTYPFSGENAKSYIGDTVRFRERDQRWEADSEFYRK
jgi:hypothetical protein